MRLLRYLWGFYWGGLRSGKGITEYFPRHRLVSERVIPPRIIHFAYLVWESLGCDRERNFSVPL